MSDNQNARQLPLLPIRGVVVFPEQLSHFDVARPKSLKALDTAMEADQTVVLAPQVHVDAEDPGLGDLCPVGTMAKVRQILRSQNDGVRILVEGLCRVSIRCLTRTRSYLEAQVEPVAETGDSDSPESLALRREAATLFDQYLQATDQTAPLQQMRMMTSQNPGFVADCIAQSAMLEYDDELALLQEPDRNRRLSKVAELLQRELQVAYYSNKLQDAARMEIEDDQRAYFLRAQMKVIQEELGEIGSFSDEEEELCNYRTEIRLLHFPKQTEEKLLRDVDRLGKQPYGSAEGAVLRNYLDTVLELPWNVTTRERVDVEAARKILDRDHYGLEKVKERILETIAVRSMAPEMPPQILCLVGPPGVGKTSIAYSIAKCLNRKLGRISLGGIHDEADIRGHRKTYIGAMPGRIITALTQADSMNPVLLLDEVDKMGADYRGDPSSALLEVLDGEQNHAYRDHYLEIPVDLSHVLFITTANTLDTVPRPLLDRMEVIELGSYTDEEKLMIAKNHLFPRQLKKHGLKKSQLRITDDGLREIIACYTRESGVRNLERCLAEVCRKADRQWLAMETPRRITVAGANLEEFLGVRKYLPDRLPCTDQVGLVTGLAWTSAGGETLEVEVNVMDGSGKLELTGNLGDVMKESARAAYSYIRANARTLGVAPDFYCSKDLHVHFPEGAVPKDGPSAGIAVCTAMVSALTGVTVRRDVAMTGEISIRGRVLPIGGLKEKTMAALRHGVQTVILPRDNQRDLEEIDQTVRRRLNFLPVERMEEVLCAALNRVPEVTAPKQPDSRPAELPVPERKPGSRQPDLRQ